MPSPRSTPKASTSSCEAPVATTSSCFSQLNFAAQARVANSPFRAAPTCTLTPLRNSASRIPSPPVQRTLRACVWQLLRGAQKNQKRNTDNARREGRGMFRLRSDDSRRLRQKFLRRKYTTQGTVLTQRPRDPQGPDRIVKEVSRSSWKRTIWKRTHLARCWKNAFINTTCSVIHFTKPGRR